MKQPLKSGIRRKFRRLASSRRPSCIALTRAVISAGTRLEATLITPSAPVAISESVSLSLPESTLKPSGRLRIISLIWA